MEFVQIGRVLMISFVVALMLLGIFFRLRKKRGIKKGQWMRPVLFGLFAILLILSYSLTIRIDQEKVSFWFGPGVIKKEIVLENIESCTPVQNKRWRGYGIRWIPTAWIYNVSGLDAVEFDLKDHEMHVRVGTDQPDKVCEEIEEMQN